MSTTQTSPSPSSPTQPSRSDVLFSILSDGDLGAIRYRASPDTVRRLAAFLELDGIPGFLHASIVAISEHTGRQARVSWPTRPIEVIEIVA